VTDIDLNAVATKLAAARTKLILDKPFLGALVLRLPMLIADGAWCPTTGTDARNFYYNPSYINSLTLAQTQFMLAHEALHCALSHFARREHRNISRWDLACDFAINPLLVADGLKPPYNAQIMDEYEGMTAEEIYPLIKDNEDNETLDQHLYDQDSQGNSGGDNPDQGQDRKNNPSGGQQQESRESAPEGNGDGQQTGKIEQQPRDEQSPSPPPPLTSEERETLEIQWQQRLAGAAQQAMQAGKMDGAMARMVDHLLQPRLPWRMLLSQYMTAVARDDFSYMRPSRRGQDDAILPSLHSAQLDVVIALDTSGSIKSGEIDEFLSEVSALKGQMRARISLIPCDAIIAPGAPWIFEPWEEISFEESIQGGGSTDFRPVFQWLDEQTFQPDLLVYFTDAEGVFPELEPFFPVLWLVKGKQKTPWGQRIQLN
jgi:predicted metal-dependent peptidase